MTQVLNVKQMQHLQRLVLIRAHGLVHGHFLLQVGYAVCQHVEAVAVALVQSEHVCVVLCRESVEAVSC